MRSSSSKLFGDLLAALYSLDGHLNKKIFSFENTSPFKIISKLLANNFLLTLSLPNNFLLESTILLHVSPYQENIFKSVLISCYQNKKKQISCIFSCKFSKIKIYCQNIPSPTELRNPLLRVPLSLQNSSFPPKVGSK